MVRDLDAEARVLIGSGKRVGDRKANEKKKKANAGSRDRTSDLQIFSLTLSQLSYTGMLELGAFAPGWRPGPALFPKPRGRTLRGVPVAKWTRRRFPEPKIVGSNPIWDVVLAGPKLFLLRNNKFQK